MACKVKVNRSRVHQKRMAFQRKLRILRSLTHSNSMKTSSIIMDAFLYISTLKLKLETLKKEKILRLIKHENHLPLLEVNTEKINKRVFRLRVTSRKGRDNLVYILQAFEEMDINVINAKVSCNGEFVMEAIVEISHANDNNNVDENIEIMDPSVLSEVILKAIERSSVSS